MRGVCFLRTSGSQNQREKTERMRTSQSGNAVLFHQVKFEEILVTSAALPGLAIRHFISDARRTTARRVAEFASAVLFFSRFAAGLNSHRSPKKSAASILPG